MPQDQQTAVFQEWVNNHQGLLFKVVRAYAFTAADRDDLFQEISVQVWRSVPSFRNESAVTTWLYRIALNTAIKWTKQERKHQEAHQPIDGVSFVLKDLSEGEDERLSWLYEEIARLNEIDRSLCLLMLDGFSYKEMSAIAGISESNVGVRINRIKKHLISRTTKT